MKTDTQWLEQWQANPQACVAVIVHVNGNPKQYIQAMQALELTVERTFRLTQTMAVRGPAQHILELLESEWVTKIEPDQPITAIKGE